MLWMITFVTLLTVGSAYDGCKVRFGRRGCYHRIIEGVLVTCDGGGSEMTVPLNLPQDTVYMSLQNFQLAHLSRASFEHLSTVQCMTIIDSGIGVVDSDAFSAMEALSELTLQNTYMNNTQVEFVSHSQFHPELLTIAESPSITRFQFPAELENLQQLKSLDIHGNSLVDLNGDIFDLVPLLERLDLSRNGMALFDWTQLHKLPALNQLNMHGNRFQTIPAEMYSVFFAIKELSLADNPFHCNCKLAWLKEFFETAQDKKLDYEFVQCASPTPVKRMQLYSSEDFVCMKPAVPMIQWLELEDGRFEVNCTSRGDPAPTLTLTLPDGQQVIVPPSDDLALIQTASPAILTESGLVQCDAINSEGSVHAEEQLPMQESSSISGLQCCYSLLLVVMAALFVS